MPWLTHHRAPRLCRVGCGRDSQETAAQSGLFSPGRVRRASARESPCQTHVVGRQRVTDGSGVALSLRKGVASARHRAERNSVTTQSPLSPKKQRQTRAPQESVHVLLTDSTSTPHGLRTRMCDRTSHPRGFIHSLTHPVTHSLIHSSVVRTQCGTRQTAHHETLRARGAAASQKKV